VGKVVKLLAARNHEVVSSWELLTEATASKYLNVYPWPMHFLT